MEEISPGQSLNKIHTLIENSTDYVQKLYCDTDTWTRPFKCAVASCPNSFVKSDEDSRLPFKFHNFPVNSHISKIWIEKCGAKSDIDTSSVKICSDHFMLDDYERNYKEEFKNSKYKRKLKLNAIPSRKLDWPQMCMKVDNDDQGASIYYENQTEFQQDPPSFKVIKMTVDENIKIKQQIEQLKLDKSEIEFKFNVYTRKCKSKNRDLIIIKRKYEKLKKNAANIKEQKNLLSKVFSDAQINILLGKKKVIWSSDDLAMAFTLRHMSSRECYLYLKQVLNMPLPALSCVQKWAASK